MLTTARGWTVLCVACSITALLGGCGSSEPTSLGSLEADPSAATATATTTTATATAPEATATPTPGPESTPVRVAVYPTEEAEDQAFVSEVAALTSWPGHEITARPTLRDWAADLALMGRASCASGSGEEARLLDPIDAAAFRVAAAGTYCPERLADLGAGQAATGPLELVPVEPRCPDSAAVIDLEVTAFDDTYGADWTATAVNNSPYDALIRVDIRDESSGVADSYADFTDEYVGDWTVATEFADSMYEPFVLAAGETRTAEGGTQSTVYEWEAPSLRVQDDFYVPLGCAVLNP